MALSEWEIAKRLLLAAAIGLLFGVEREYNHKPAGMRTHTLICLTACVLALISAYGFGDSMAAYGPKVQRVSDPARLLVGILTGVGCIGAGIIWKSSSGGIQGITTTAGVLLVTALGMACGLGLFYLAFLGALIGLLAMLSENLIDYLRKRRTEKKAKRLAQETDESPSASESSRQP